MKGQRDWIPGETDLDWIESIAADLPPALAAIEAAAAQPGIPIVDRDAGRVLSVLAGGRRRIVEVGTAYGLIAEAVTFPEDRGSVTYRLNAAARFQDGQPITPADIVFSFDTLKATSPFYAAYFHNVVGAAAEGERPERAMISITAGVDGMQAAADACRAGAAAVGFCELYVHTAYDASIAPPGKHMLSVFAQYAPYGTDTAAAGELVLARALGRPLTPDESVHHRNGHRTDNRLANLELWSRYQPSGQRVEDLLAWAYELLRRYDAPSWGLVSSKQPDHQQ